MENNYIKLENEIFDNLGFTNEEVTVLVLIYRNYMQYKGLSLCSLKLIAEDYMKYNTNNNKDILPKIKETIGSLIKKEYISKVYDTYYNPIEIDSIKDKNTMFYLELIESPGANYFMVYDNDINSIFERLKSSKLSKFNIIRYYIACCRVRNNEQKVGHLTQSKMKGLIDDSRTIQAYNKILQDDLHLIRYDNNYMSEDKHYVTTFIGHWDDEENFNFQVTSEVSCKGLVYTDKKTSNKRRSVKQKINNIEKNIDVTEENEKLKKQLENYKKKYGELEHKPKEDNEKGKGAFGASEDSWGEKDIFDNIDNENNKTPKEGKVSEIRKNIDELIRNNPKKEMEFIQKFGGVNWEILNKVQLDIMFIQIQKFFRVEKEIKDIWG